MAGLSEYASPACKHSPQLSWSRGKFRGTDRQDWTISCETPAIAAGRQRAPSEASWLARNLVERPVPRPGAPSPATHLVRRTAKMTSEWNDKSPGHMRIENPYVGERRRSAAVIASFASAEPVKNAPFSRISPSELVAAIGDGRPSNAASKSFGNAASLSGGIDLARRSLT